MDERGWIFCHHFWELGNVQQSKIITTCACCKILFAALTCAKHVFDTELSLSQCLCSINQLLCSSGHVGGAGGS